MRFIEDFQLYPLVIEDSQDSYSKSPVLMGKLTNSMAIAVSPWLPNAGNRIVVLAEEPSLRKMTLNVSSWTYSVDIVSHKSFRPFPNRVSFSQTSFVANSYRYQTNPPNDSHPSRTQFKILGQRPWTSTICFPRGGAPPFISRSIIP